MGDKVKPPKLPAGAPKELRDFLACKVMEVDLDPANAGWIPKPDLVPDGVAPNITPTATGTNAVSVNVGWGFVSINLPVTLSGGQLQVDATNLPGQRAIEEWVTKFNDALRSNNKELSGLEIRNGKIHLTKRVIGAAQPATTPAVAPTPTTTPTPATGTTQTTPSTTPETTPGTTQAEGDGLKPGCLIGIVVALVLFLGAGIAFLVGRGDDDAKTSDSIATTSSGPRTTLEPLAEGAVCADLETLQRVMDAFGVSDPCQLDPEDFWDACDDGFMPCFSGIKPLIVLGKLPGITHDGSVPDADTGEVGPSQADHRAQIVGPVFDQSAWIEVTSRCGNNTITGRSMPAATASTSILHPLYNFGQCQADLFYQSASVRQFLGSYDYSVSDAAIEAGTPVTAGISVPTETSLNSIGTTLGFLGGKKLGLDCIWYTADSAALALDACPNDRWVFNAGWNDPRVLSYGAGYINPLGTAAVTEEQISSFGPSRLFGDGTLYPCGPGHLGYTACVDDDEDVNTSFFIAGTVTWNTRLDEMEDGTYLEVGVEDSWVRLLRDATNWKLTSSYDSNPRAILRGNSVTFMIPYDKPAVAGLDYTLSVGDSSGVIEQAPQPVMGQLTSTQGPETPADFVSQLSKSFATGDLTYAFNRLHPLVLNAFSAELCQAELALRINADYLVTVDSVGEIAPWTWELPDGRSFDVEAATTVTIRIPGNANPVEAHLVNIDRMYYWFTICDAR